MTSEQRQAVYKKQEESPDNWTKVGKPNDKKWDGRTKVGFKSDTTRNINNASIREENEDDDDEEEDDFEVIIKPSINSIMTSVRKINPIMCNSSMTEIHSYGLIDSGADTYMISQDDFYIESQDDSRRVAIEGFDGPNHVVRNLRIGCGITACEFENQIILVRINEAVITEYKTIIATNQV